MFRGFATIKKSLVTIIWLSILLPLFTVSSCLDSCGNASIPDSQTTNTSTQAEDNDNTPSGFETYQHQYHGWQLLLVQSPTDLQYNPQSDQYEKVDTDPESSGEILVSLPYWLMLLSSLGILWKTNKESSTEEQVTNTILHGLFAVAGAQYYLVTEGVASVLYSLFRYRNLGGHLQYTSFVLIALVTAYLLIKAPRPTQSHPVAKLPYYMSWFLFVFNLLSILVTYVYAWLILVMDAQESTLFPIQTIFLPALLIMSYLYLQINMNRYIKGQTEDTPVWLWFCTTLLIALPNIAFVIAGLLDI